MSLQVAQEGIAMGTWYSKVPALMATRGLDAMDLVRGANISYDTANRLAKGDVGVRTETIQRLLTFFSLRSVDDLFEFRVDEPGK